MKMRIQHTKINERQLKQFRREIYNTKYRLYKDEESQINNLSSYLKNLVKEYYICKTRRK